MNQDSYNEEHYADLTAKHGMKRFEFMRAKSRFEKTLTKVIQFLDQWGYQLIGQISVIETRTGKVWTSRRHQ